MISLDWKERLQKDVDDFYSRKLKEHDYDLGIIYNAYPSRIDNKVPKEVVEFVANNLASKLAKTAENHVQFYDYLWNEKGEDGKIAFACIMSKVAKKKPDFFLNYLKEILMKISDSKHITLLIDKGIYPAIKKNPSAYLEYVCSLLKTNNETFAKGVVKLILKLLKTNPELISPVYKKMEGAWLHANPLTVKINIQFMKMLGVIDKKFYLSVYQNYKLSREPIFAEILSNAIVFYDETIDCMVTNWAASGNVKLKKAGIAGKKIINRLKKN
ncbi:MAG: hypothetical protein PHR06_03840 [Candidatus Cloacimonetes bacterium]|nr:hypothetical protein [Candidatus Cloacimonadota bacterium]